MAARADMGICLARTDPDVPKHRGITYFLVDMKSPGIEVRPLREITGAALFNEVFFDGCFVPDDCVVGEVDGGWRLARTTLANERVSLSSDSAFGGALEGVLERVAAQPDRAGPGHPGSARAPAGRGPVAGPAGRAGHPALRWAGCSRGRSRACASCWGRSSSSGSTSSASTSCGPDGAVTEGEAAVSAHGVLQSKCLTIAGGTSEVQRNVIGERLLGLPRDPEPGR